MALADDALITLEELNHALGQDADSGDYDEAKEEIINRRSSEVLAFLDRRLLTASYTEYHTAHKGQDELVLGEWPVTAVTTVHEDASWKNVALASRYGASALLTNDTDYIVIKPTTEPGPFGRLLRLNATWSTVRRAVKVVYTAGYATRALIPGPIKAVVIDMCAIAWREQSKKEWGLASRSDMAGNVSRFVPAILTQKQQDALFTYSRQARAPHPSIETWERDAA